MASPTPASAPPVERGAHFVSSDVVRATLAWSACIDAIEAAYRRPGAGADAVAPARTVASSPNGQWLRTLPAIPGAGQYFGAKFMGGKRATSSIGPVTEYLIVLFDRETGHLAGFVDGHLVTAYRTAATTAVGLRRLAARRGGAPLSVGVLGTGLEAQMHLRAVAAVMPVRDVTMFSPTAERRGRVVAQLADELGLPVAGVNSAAAAVGDAELVITAARSYDESPILSVGDLSRCHTIGSIGSTVPSQRELDIDILGASDVIVCDVPDEVTEETGDFLAAIAAGQSFGDRVFGIGALTGDVLPEAIATSKLALYKSVGSGVQDVVIAEVAMQAALAAGTATPLPMLLDTKN